MDDISRVFAKLVLQRKLSAAVKFLDKERSSGLLDLSPEIKEAAGSVQVCAGYSAEAEAAMFLTKKVVMHRAIAMHNL